MQINSKWTTVNGCRMFSRGAGVLRAPAVVLVHGLGVSSSYMVPLIEELAADFRVYAPDLPGFGQSDKPAQALTIRELAEALDGWLRAVDVERAMVVGHSMGCQVLVELADLRPECIQRAVLLGPAMDATAGHPLAHVWRLLLDQWWEPPSLIVLEVVEFCRNGPLRTIQQFRNALRHDMEGRVARIRARSAILRGEHDRIVSQEWVDRLAARLGTDRVESVPGAGHAFHYSVPQVVGRVLREMM